MKKVFFKSESFCTCPGDIMDSLNKNKKITVFDDVVTDDYFIITRSGCENGFLVTCHDGYLGYFKESDTYSYDILYSMILQFLTDDNYTFFD